MKKKNRLSCHNRGFLSCARTAVKGLRDMYPSMEGVINLPFQIAHLLVKLRLDDVTRPHEFRSKCFQQFLWILQRTTEVVFEEDDVFSAYNTTGFDAVLSKPVNQMCNASICFKPYDLDSDGVLSLADNCNDSSGADVHFHFYGAFVSNV